MNRKYLHVAGVVFVILLGACSSQVNVDGNVFTETNGKATKLALVDIQIIPEDVFKANIKQQLLKTEEEAKRIKVHIDRQQRSLDNILKASAEVMGNTMGYAAMGGSAYGGAVGTSISLLGQAAGAVASVEESLAKLHAEVEGLKSGNNGKFFYPTGLQGEIQKVASNADGNFKLTLNKGKRVVLAAAKDDLYWLLWIDPSKINGPITLTNNNLNGTACSECVFTATSTPSSL
jgi:hypothetical protein